ncbi:MAG: aminomethyltransferase family protein [Candidatus Krumholzibacteriia bacterium]
MPIPTPFHERTFENCVSLLYKDWAGYYAVRSYDTYPEREYFAFRHTAGLVDVTPLFKYEVYGKDAAALLSRIMVRNIARLKPGRVAYTCWCDDDGKVIDDGTVSRLDEDYYRVTSTEPNLAWLHRFARGCRVTIEDSSRQLGALALQGPRSRDILQEATEDDITGLKYFAVRQTQIDGCRVYVSRTGYTGDLGYEVWVESGNATRIWDALNDIGQKYGMLPAGLDAMDITRVEAGFVLNGIDYFNANHCLVKSRKSTPFELGFGWMVKIKRGPFNGRDALALEKLRGPARMLVGLEIGWDEHEALFAAKGLPPEIPSQAWRTSAPVYDDTGTQVGYATSGTWSPILKKNLALATVYRGFETVGTRLQFEVTVEYERKTVPATVAEKPFFDPERKKR